MVWFLEPRQHMGPRKPLSPALAQECFPESPLEQPTPTNAVFMTRIKGTITLLEVLHTTSPCTDMSPYIVVLTYKGTTCLHTSS